MSPVRLHPLPKEKQHYAQNEKHHVYDFTPVNVLYVCLAVGHMELNESQVIVLHGKHEICEREH
jgi:hypothetical protein